MLYDFSFAFRCIIRRHYRSISLYDVKREYAQTCMMYGEAEIKMAEMLVDWQSERGKRLCATIFLFFLLFLPSG